jgi:hypothetical protein
MEESNHTLPEGIPISGLDILLPPLPIPDLYASNERQFTVLESDVDIFSIESSSCDNSSECSRSYDERDDSSNDINTFETLFNPFHAIQPSKNIIVDESNMKSIPAPDDEGIEKPRAPKDELPNYYDWRELFPFLSNLKQHSAAILQEALNVPQVKYYLMASN